MVALSSTFVATVLSLSVLASAYDIPSTGVQVQRIRRSSNQHGHALHRRAPSTIPKRCKVKGAKPASVASISSGKKPTNQSSGSSDPDDGSSSSSSSSSSGSGSSSSSSSGSVGHQSGTIHTNGGSSCPVNASPNPTKQSGPNGSIDFLNCGIDGGGWAPPNIHIDDLVVVPLAKAGAALGPCKQYMSIFQSAANRYGLPDILLASIAMQESSCNKNSVGQGGEQGIMQISKDKCEGRGDGCRDPTFNINKGAEYLAGVIKANGGNIIKSMGEYNGWYPGLTRAKATHAAHTDCCRCQNNLDYLQTLFNGWLQGIEPGSLKQGKYFNLDVCGGDDE